MRTILYGDNDQAEFEIGGMSLNEQGQDINHIKQD